MSEPTTTTYALLGLLAVKPWTGYELTQQVKRSLHYMWPSSEAHLYREQKRLVQIGWATVEKEPVGKRTRNRYAITPAGRRAFRAWLETEPGSPSIEIEGLVRAFFADHGSLEAFDRALRTTSTQSREAIEWLLERLRSYVEDGGPFPERVHLIALVCDLVTDLLERIEAFMDEVSEELRDRNTLEPGPWEDATRRHLKRALARFRSNDR